eukprot:14836130-Heterocapsa_arctica.AAC.1
MARPSSGCGRGAVARPSGGCGRGLRPRPSSGVRGCGRLPPIGTCARRGRLTGPRRTSGHRSRPVRPVWPRSGASHRS